MAKCIFCNKANQETQEHVFPKWLLNQKKLYDDRLKLLNGTEIPYRQLTIPVCQKCNNETLSHIEEKVQRGTANELQHYLWTIKIYIGILFKESGIRLDRSSKTKESVVRLQDLKSELGILLQLFNTYKNKGSFHPNPPGSVIKIERRKKYTFFDYVDTPHIPIIGIALPREFIICLPYDKGRAKRVFDKNYFLKEETDVEFRFLVADLGYDEYRWQESFSSITVDDEAFISPSSYKMRQSLPFNDIQFKEVLKAVGLKGEKRGEQWRVEKTK